MTDTRNPKEFSEVPLITSSQVLNLDHQEPSEKYSRIPHNNVDIEEMDLGALYLLSIAKTWKYKDPNSLLEHQVKILNTFILKSRKQSQYVSIGQTNSNPLKVMSNL